MADDPLLPINNELFIPRAELRFRASRSGGPGGQHVNTSATRIELEWDVQSSASISEDERTRIRDRLANRINQQGVLQLAESGSRSQHQNKEVVTERFQELLRNALRIEKRRRKTRPSRAARERRLRAKKRRSEKKQLRGPVRPDE